MYKMPTIINNKCVYLDECTFCKNVVITDECKCGLGYEPSDKCKYSCYITDVSARIKELFEKLPDNYGEETE